MILKAYEIGLDERTKTKWKNNNNTQWNLIIKTIRENMEFLQ